MRQKLKGGKLLFLAVVIYCSAGCNILQHSVRNDMLQPDELPVLSKQKGAALLYFKKVETGSISGGCPDNYREWMRNILALPWEKVAIVKSLPDRNNSNSAEVVMVVSFRQKYLAGGGIIRLQVRIDMLDAKGKLITHLENTSDYEVWGPANTRDHINAAKKLFIPLAEKIADNPQIASFLSQQPKHMLSTSTQKTESKPLQKNLSNVQSRKWAVVIGLGKYQATKSGCLNSLDYADDDAEDFAATLKKLGWKDSHIKLLTNEQATERNIKIALASWLSKAGKDDMVVLYWSGHGFPDPEDPEKVYFACYDTDIDIPATGFRMDRVRDMIEEHKVKNVVLLADTCHAGKLITRGDKGMVAVGQYMSKLRRNRDLPKGWIFMVSAESDRKAIEHSSWKNGAFTHCLLQALNGGADGYESVGSKDGVVTMLELRAYLSTEMPDQTQKILGVAKRPVIITNSGNPAIWNISLNE